MTEKRKRIRHRTLLKFHAPKKIEGLGAEKHVGKERIALMHAL